MEKLVRIQHKLKAPKAQYNSFGKYKYRNCEDILEAVKPLLAEEGLLLTICDKILEVGGITFVESTATICDGTATVLTSAQAGIDINRKGMDIAQSFGSSSSYARKCALNGLFLIDDTKDADATNLHDSAPKTPAMTKKEAVDSMTEATDMKSLGAAWTKIPGDLKKDKDISELKELRKTELGE